jgi:hypothetical protein
MKHWGGSVMVWAAISWYSILLVALLYFIADYVYRLSIEVHPIIQMLFPNNDAVVQDDSALIHTA